MLDILHQASLDAARMVASETERLCADIAALYLYTLDDFKTKLEVRSYELPGRPTVVAIHDRALGIDLSPRLTHGIEGLAYVVRRIG